jgi:rhomboid protease GluP
MENETPETPETPAAPAPEAEAAPAPSGPETTAVYLARSLIADRGYTDGVVAEAMPFVAACDYVLTKGDGVSFTLVLIVDREAHPERRFGMTLDQVVAVAAACHRYTGTVSGQKMPVVVQIWEVGRGDPEWARLAGLRRRAPGKQKVSVVAFAVDAGTGKVRSTAPWNGIFAGRRYVEKLLAAPQRTPEEVAHAFRARRAAAPAQVRGVPYVTIAIMAVLSLIFVGELVFGPRPWGGLLEPDITTLVAAGGMSKTLVNEGEWWRLFTCAFLHGGLMHLVFNGFALVLAGVVLESLLGRAWLLALFVIGALGGAGMSYLLNGANVVSVGASGAIMGLLAAALVSTARLAEGAERTQTQMMLMRILIPSLLPLAVHTGSGSVDYGAHLGGAIVGALAGIVLLKTWPAGAPHPRFLGFARAAMFLGLALFVTGFAEVKIHYPKYIDQAQSVALLDFLAPREQLNALGDDELMARVEGLVQKYPRDPQLRFQNARRLLKTNDLAGAEREITTALAEKEILTRLFNPSMEIILRALLGAILLDEGKHDEAVAAVASVCHAGPGGSVPEQLADLNLCP